MESHKTVDGEALRIDAVRAMLGVLDSVGGPVALAKLLGETPHRVSSWREIPIRHVFAVEAFTGIAHGNIRPDIDFTAPHFSACWSDGDGEQEGVDVTHLVGAAPEPENSGALADLAFREFQAAHGVAAEYPCVRNWRAAVQAFEKFELAVALL